MTLDEQIEKFKGFKEVNKTDDDFSADYDEWVSTIISWLEELKAYREKELKHIHDILPPINNCTLLMLRN